MATRAWVRKPLSDLRLLTADHAFLTLPCLSCTTATVILQTSLYPPLSALPDRPEAFDAQMLIFDSAGSLLERHLQPCVFSEVR